MPRIENDITYLSDNIVVFELTQSIEAAASTYTDYTIAYPIEIKRVLFRSLTFGSESTSSEIGKVTAALYASSTKDVTIRTFNNGTSGRVPWVHYGVIAEI